MASNNETGLSIFSRVMDIGPSPDPDTIDDYVRVIVIEIQTSDPIALKAYLYQLIHKSLDSEDHGTYRLMIFDGQYLFREQEFRITDHQKRKIQIFRASNDSLMLIQLYEHIQVAMATNPCLRMIVIIANPSILFPDLVDQITQYLFSLSISVRIVLMVDYLIKSQVNFYRQKPSSVMLRCHLEGTSDAGNQIHLTINKNDVRSIPKTITL